MDALKLAKELKAALSFRAEVVGITKQVSKRVRSGSRKKPIASSEHVPSGVYHVQLDPSGQLHPDVNTQDAADCLCADVNVGIEGITDELASELKKEILNELGRELSIKIAQKIEHITSIQKSLIAMRSISLVENGCHYVSLKGSVTFSGELSESQSQVFCTKLDVFLGNIRSPFVESLKTQLLNFVA